MSVPIADPACPHGRCGVAEALIALHLDRQVSVPIPDPRWCVECRRQTAAPSVAAPTAAVGSLAAGALSDDPKARAAILAVTRAARSGRAPPYRSRAGEAAPQVAFRGEGVGDLLHGILAERYTLPSGCSGCRRDLEEMNRRGPDWCRANARALGQSIWERARHWVVAEAAWADRLRAAQEFAGGLVTGRGPVALIADLVRQACELAERTSRPKSLDPRVTVLVTAFNRPRHLKQCVDSFQHWHPGIRIVVADNGNQPADVAVPTYLRLPFDCGLSAARNAGVRTIGTDYVLLCEDDFVCDERAQIAGLIDVLDSYPEIGVACGVSENGYRGPQNNYSFRLDRGAAQWRYRGPLLTTAAGTEFWIADGGANFALFRRCVFDTVRWDERLKVGEHEQFYRELQGEGRWNVAVVPGSRIGHDTHGRGGDYLSFRLREAALRGQFASPTGPPSKVNAESPRCVIVAGTGRCGTSLVAGWLRDAGVYMGHTFVPADAANPLGYWEDAAVLALLSCRDLAGLGRLIRLRNATQPLWGLKQPWLFEQWPAAVALPWPRDTRVLHCTRGAAAVIDSYRRAYPHLAAQADDWYRIRQADVAAFLADARSRGWPVEDVAFDRAKAMPDECRASVVAFAAQVAPAAAPAS